MSNPMLNTLAIVAAIIAVVLIVITIAVYKFRVAQLDSDNTGDRPDFDTSKAPPSMWAITDYIDPNQMSNEQFEMLFKMTREEWVEQQGGWETISPFRRWRAKKLSDEQFEQLLDEMKDGNKAKRRRRGVVGQSVYRGIK